MQEGKQFRSIYLVAKGQFELIKSEHTTNSTVHLNHSIIYLGERSIIGAKEIFENLKTN